MTDPTARELLIEHEELLKNLSDVLWNYGMNTAARQVDSALERLHAHLAATPEPMADLPPKVGHILRLAEVICEVDGSHSLGATALAEAILSHPGSRWQPATPEPAAGPTDEELLSIDELREAWNMQADAANSWDELGIDEIVCWAQRQALARWGHQPPQPIPLDEQMPGPEEFAWRAGESGPGPWCLVARQTASGAWNLHQQRLDFYRKLDDQPDIGKLARWLKATGWTHWLPRHTLRLPEPPQPITLNDPPGQCPASGS